MDMEMEIKGIWDTLGSINITLKEMGGRFDYIDTRLDGIDARLDAMDVRLDGIDARLDAMDVRLDGMDSRFNQIDAKIDTLQSSTIMGFERVIGYLDGINKRVDVIEDVIFSNSVDIRDHELRISRIEQLRS